MYRVTLSFLACLAVCSALPLDNDGDFCKNFYKSVPFNASALEGVWTAAYRITSSPEDQRKTADVKYESLTPEEVTTFKDEVGVYFPSISWEKVKYSRTLVNVKPILIQHEDYTVSVTLFKYLLEIDEKTGEVNQIPAGDVFDFLKKTNSPVPYPTLPYKMKVLGDGNYLATIFCDLKFAYIEYKSSEIPAPSVEELKKLAEEVGFNREGLFKHISL